MKYTKLERNWVMYDVGNSALVLLNTSVVPIYFNAINTGASSADLVVAWGSAQTIASLVIAMLMPILGALADYAGNKIRFFLGFFLTGLGGSTTTFDKLALGNLNIVAVAISLRTRSLGLGALALALGSGSAVVAANRTRARSSLLASTRCTFAIVGHKTASLNR